MLSGQQCPYGKLKDASDGIVQTYTMHFALQVSDWKQ